MRSHLRSFVIRDRNATLEALGSVALRVDSSKSSADLFKAVRPLLGLQGKVRSGLRPLPSLRRADGTWASTPVERAEVFQEHFMDAVYRSIERTMDIPIRVIYLGGYRR